MQSPSVSILTRAAIQEARQMGLTPFCVTIAEQAEDYLPYLFGSKGFVVVKDAAALPQVLPRLYAQLTTASSAQV
jgi:nitric oxide reductase NorD protein